MSIYSTTSMSSCGRISCLVFGLILMLRIHGIAAQTIPTPTTTSSYIVIIKLSGRPSALMTATQMAALEARFKRAYSDIEEAAWKVKKPPFYRNVTQVSMDVQSLTGWPNGTVTQTFDVLGRVEIACHGCQDELRLFSNLTATGRFRLFSYDPWYGPTPSAFTTVLNRYIKADRSINAIDRVIRSQQLENINCSADETIVTTATVVDFTGYPTLSTNDQLQVLAQGFQDTYNRLNGIGSDTCDVYFRQITAVADSSSSNDYFEQGQSARFLATTTATQAAYNSVKLPFSLIFRVKFRCRACPARSTLFANDAVKRRLGEQEEVDPHDQRQLDALRVLQQGFSSSSFSSLNNTECACRPDASKPRAPTLDEFLGSYNTTVQLLNQKGTIEFATSVDGGVELEPKPCIANVTTQSIIVAVDVRGTKLSLLTKADTTALEEGFVKAYTRVAENACDAFFRVVGRTSIIEIVPGDAAISNSLAPSVYTLYLQVQFSCRGCPRNAKIFHGAAGRRLRDGGRRLVEQDTCYCTRGVTNLNAPTQDEFGFYYKDVVSTMNLSTAVSLVSVTDSVCPKYFDSCDGTYKNGCETSLLIDKNNCGSCGTVCDGIDALCIRGQCDCDITPFSNFTLNGKVGANAVTDFPKFLEFGSGCGLRLTPDTAIQRSSSAFAPITMQNTNFSFSVSFSYRMFGEEAGQADGIAFVLHQDPRGVSALGSSGGGLGAYGIRPALIVELDTYKNPDLNDDSDRHIQITVSRNAIMSELAQRRVSELRTDPGVIAGLWIDYDGTTIKVYHNVESDKEKPPKPSVVATVSLVGLFRNNQLFFGFSAATWNQGDNHDIVAWSFNQ